MTAHRTTGQHILPHFLIRHFAARRRKKQSQVFLFRRDAQECVLVNTGDVAKRRLFYGEPDETGIEEALAKEEQRFAPVVARLVDRGRLAEGDRETLFQFIANLTIRTHHLRSGLSAQAARVFETVQDAFTGEQAAQIIHRMLKKDPKVLRDAIRGAVQQVPSFPREPRLHILLDRMAEQHFLQYLEEGNVPFGEQIKAILSAVAGNLDWDDLARNSHLQALRRDLSPEARLATYRSLRWNIASHESASLILGDFGPVGVCPDSKELRTLSALGKDVERILLPLSDSVLLIGDVQGAIDVDLEHLRRRTAAMSAEFFIAAQDTEQERAVHGLIGTDSELLTDDEISQARTRTFGEQAEPADLPCGQSLSISVSRDGTVAHSERAMLELTTLAALIEQSVEETGISLETRLTLLLTDDLRESVRSISREYGYESDVALDGRAVPVFGKTLYRSFQPPLEVTIVVHCDLWDNDEPDLVVTRLQLVLSQIMGVLMAGRHTAVDEDNEATELQTFAEELDQLAQEMLSIHDAQVLARKYLAAFCTATDEAGNPAEPTDLIATAYIAPIQELLLQVGGVVEEHIQPYREYRVSLDVILPATLPVVRELLIAMAHMLGLASERVSALIPEYLSASAGFSEYLSEDWDLLIEAFKRQDQSDARRSLADVTTGIFARMGLYIDDVNGGEMDLIVGTPTFLQRPDEGSVV